MVGDVLHAGGGGVEEDVQVHARWGCKVRTVWSTTLSVVKTVSRRAALPSASVFSLRLGAQEVGPLGLRAVGGDGRVAGGGRMKGVTVTVVTAARLALGRGRGRRSIRVRSLVPELGGDGAGGGEHGWRWRRGGRSCWHSTAGVSADIALGQGRGRRRRGGPRSWAGTPCGSEPGASALAAPLQVVLGPSWASPADRSRSGGWLKTSREQSSGTPLSSRPG